MKGNSMTINSAALSKINWTQIVSMGAMLATVFGFDITPETQVQILAGITAIGTVATFIFRTFFTAKPL
jgi:uncharacterized protein (DUF697 family)